MFRKYRLKQTTEMRPYKLGEPLYSEGVRISRADANAGAPHLGDMIARDPDKPSEQWLVSAADFAAHFVEVE